MNASASEMADHSFETGALPDQPVGLARFLVARVRATAPRRWASIVLVGAALLLALCLIRRCFSFAVFPDELHFLNFIRGWNEQGGGALPPNHDGYGSSWWMLVNLLDHEFHPRLYLHTNRPSGPFPMLTPGDTAVYAAIFAGRLASLAALLTAIAFAIAKARPAVNQQLMFGLLVLPLVWWDGKWMSPDFFAISCAVVAGALLCRQSQIAALFFLGAAIGLRLSNLPALGGFILLAVANQRLTIRAACCSALALVAGYVATNPFVLMNFSLAYENAQGVPSTAELTWANLWRVTWNCTVGNRREWDLPSTGSIAYWWGSVLLPIALAFALLKSRQYLVLAAIVLSFGLGLLAIGYRGLGYGWYFMPTVAASYVLAVGTISFDAWSAMSRRLTIGVIGLALLISATTSLSELQRNRAGGDALTQRGKRRTACGMR